MNRETLRYTPASEALVYPYSDLPDGSRWMAGTIKPRFLGDSELSQEPISWKISHFSARPYDYWQEFIRTEFPLIVENSAASTVDVLCFLKDFKTRESESRYHQSCLQTFQESYEDRKDKIKNSRGQPIPSKLQGLQAELFPQICQTQERLSAAIELNRSLSLAFVKKYFLTPGGLHSLDLAINDISSASDQSLQLENLIGLSIDSFGSLVRSGELPSILDYKPDNYNLSNSANAQVLRELIVAAFPDSDHQSSILQNSALKILEQYLIYQREGDKSPLLGYTHDLLFTAGLNNDKVRFKEVAVWLETCFQKKEFKSRFHKEARAFKSITTNDDGDLVVFVGPDIKRIHRYPQLERDEVVSMAWNRAKSWLEQNSNHFASGIYCDRYEGLCAAAAALPEISFLQSLSSATPTDEINSINPSLEDHYILNFFSALQSLRYPQVQTLDGVASNLMEKNLYLNRVGLTSENVWQSQLSERLEKDIPENIQLIDRSNRQIIRVFARDSITEDSQVVEDIRLENTALRHQIFSGIFDGKRWFVSSAGDCFTDTNDPELLGKFKKITFFQSSFPQNSYRLEIEYPWSDVNNKEITTLLFTPQGLTYEDGTSLSLPVWLEAPFENIIAKRLHYIVSGLANDHEVILENQTGAETNRTRRRPAHIRRYDRYLASPEYLQKKQELKSSGVIDLWAVASEWRLVGEIGHQMYYKDVGYVAEEKNPSLAPAAPRLLKYHP